MLRLDRMRALVDVYPGVDREDEMVAAFDYCLHGKGGAAPSIDTAMHGLVDAAHVDHLHPDSGIAIATAADGEKLTEEIFGDKVVWVPWRRPGFQLGLDIAAIKAQQPAGDRLHPRRARHHRLGRHQRRRPRRTRCGSSTPPRPTSPSTRGRSRSARRSTGTPRCPTAERRAQGRRAGADDPVDRLAGPADGRPLHRLATWCWTSSPRAEHPRLAALGTSCPDHFLRTKVKPLVLDLPADRDGRGVDRPAARAARGVPRGLPGLLRPQRRRRTRPAIRGADPLIVLVPGVGMFSFGKDKQTARVAGEFYVNAINVMRGAEGLSTYAPIDEAEKFRIEYWALEEAKLQRMPKPKPLATRIALVTGAASGIGKAIAHQARRRGRLRGRSPTSTLEKAQAAAAEIGGTDVAVGVQVDVSDEAAVAGGRRRGAAGVRRPRPGRQQRRPVAVQVAARDHRRRLGPAARRDGQGLVPGRPRPPRRC